MSVLIIAAGDAREPGDRPFATKDASVKRPYMAIEDQDRANFGIASTNAGSFSEKGAQIVPKNLPLTHEISLHHDTTLHHQLNVGSYYGITNPDAMNAAMILPSAAIVTLSYYNRAGMAYNDSP